MKCGPSYAAEVFRDWRGQWRWRIQHRSGRLVAISGGRYLRSRHARADLSRLLTSLDRNNGLALLTGRRQPPMRPQDRPWHPS